ncbi:MAG TPA: carbohydrate ABC transporter permease [Bacillota bacterium]|nr:carbohydrate ABC transporter permease [Bacillota bacterium]
MKKYLGKFGTYVLLVAIAIFLTFPFLWVLATSFKGRQETIFSYPPVWIPMFPTWENYQAVFNQVNILRCFINSIIVTSIGVFLNVITAALAAYPIARMQFWGKRFIFALILAPMMIPIQGTMIVNFLTLKQLHLLDTYLGAVITTAVFIIGVFVMKNAFEAIPHEIEEAARVDGCGEFKMWRRIMLPMIKPTLAAVAILGFVYYWNDFMWPLIVLRDANKITLQIGLTRLESAFQTNYRYVAAGAVMSMIPILVFFAFTQKYFIEGAKGAIKG